MLHLFQAFSRLLANYTSIFVIGVAVFTFFFPHTFDWVRGITQTVILGIIMLTMGLTLTTNDFKILAQRPLDVFIGACAQFIIMPGVAYLLVHVWGTSTLPLPSAFCSWAVVLAVCRATS